jgi:hypothetical protein
MRAWIAGAFIVMALAGCLGGQDDVTLNAVVGPLAVLDRDVLGGGAAVVWQGSDLVAPPPRDDQMILGFMTGVDRPECGPENCERVPFEVAELDGPLVVSIHWQPLDDDYQAFAGYLGAPALFMDLSIERDGVIVAEGIESGHYASVARFDATPGHYEAVVRAAWGTGSYLGGITVDTRTQPAGEQLPDLVLLPPAHLRVENPLARQASAVQTQTNPAEDRDVRCLRFAGIVGNQGVGAFELVLEYQQALASLTGAGTWEQLIFDENGAVVRTKSVGPAQYHAVHGHFHILEFVATQLYRVDAESYERLEPIGEGRKMGFCLIDGGIIDQFSPAVEPVYFGAGCCYMAVFCQLDLATHERFYMGISPGWYDIYPWYRADQYVEISGIEDGVYELVSVVNPTGVLVEENAANNEASVLFRLTGNAVEELQRSTQAHMGPQP